MSDQDLVLCIPNVSEGRDLDMVEHLADTIRNSPGIRLLHIDVGHDVNRTVFSFVGNSSDIFEAAFHLIQEASKVVDMAQHTGHHPRIGATDVCPFVPLKGITLSKLAELSHGFGRRVGFELGFPIYMYEASAVMSGRVNLASLRKGGYENIAIKMTEPNWQPDYGPFEFNPRTGATVIGARRYLIAFNINLSTSNVSIARKIASRIRQEGDPLKTFRPNRLPGLRSIGWYIEEYGLAQVSTNITDIEHLDIYEVFEGVKSWAKKYGAKVVGSELIGVIPKHILLKTGRYYVEKRGIADSDNEKEIIRYAVKALKLDSLKKFDIEKRVLEYALEALL